MNIRMTLGAAVALSLGWSALPAKAAVVITVEQVGGDVIASGGGAVDTADLEPPRSAKDVFPTVEPDNATLIVGSSDGSAAPWSGATGPASFGPDDGALADTGTGDLVGVQFGDEIMLPLHYVSGAPLFGTATFDNATFASLGLTPGVYVYSWGSGADADSLTIDVGAAVPEASTWAMMLAGFAGLGLLSRRGLRKTGRLAV